MKSRTFCCSGAIMKKDLLRGAPLWGIYLLIWLVAMPLSLLSQRGWRDPVEMQYLVLEAAVVSSHIIPFFYGLGVACLLFSYLYRSRNANFFAALPLRRESLFAAKYLTGLLYLLLPNLVISVVTVLMGAALGVNVAAQVLAWFAMSALGYVFYFSFAVLCAMVVGHLAALPLLYGVLHFTAIVLETIVRALMDNFVYGWYSAGYTLEFLSPLWYCLTGHGASANWTYDDAIHLTGCYLTGWKTVLIYAAVGVVFALAAFWMYRRRRMESAGDVIAVRQLKPVFLYCFTVGCSLVIGWILATMLDSDSESGRFLPVLCCLLVGAVLGYFGGEMLLHKSLRVFRKRNWANCAVACAVIAAALCCCRLDVFGYSSYVPEAEAVAAVSLDYNNSYSEDPRLIAQVTALHQDIVDQRPETDQAGSRWIYLGYRLKNGKEICRCYLLPQPDGSAVTGGTLLERFEDAFNDPDYIVARTLPTGYTEADIRLVYVSGRTADEQPYEKYLSAAEGYALLKNAVEPDLRESGMGVVEWTYRTDRQEKVDVETSSDWYVGIEIEFQDHQRCYLSLTSDAVHTIQTLMDLGVPAELFGSES